MSKTAEDKMGRAIGIMILLGFVVGCAVVALIGWGAYEGASYLHDLIEGL